MARLFIEQFAGNRVKPDLLIVSDENHKITFTIQKPGNGVREAFEIDISFQDAIALRYFLTKVGD